MMVSNGEVAAALEGIANLLEILNENPFKVNITASIRYIADLSAIHESLIVLSSGQSAHLLSAHRTDMCDLFMKGEYIPWHFSSQQYAADSEGVTTLRPR